MSLVWRCLGIAIVIVHTLISVVLLIGSLLIFWHRGLIPLYLLLLVPVFLFDLRGECPLTRWEAYCWRRADPLWVSRAGGHVANRIYALTGVVVSNDTITRVTRTLEATGILLALFLWFC